MSSGGLVLLSGAGHFAQGPGIIGRRAPPGEIGQRVEGNAPEQKSPRVGGGKERLVKAEGR